MLARAFPSSRVIPARRAQGASAAMNLPASQATGPLGAPAKPSPAGEVARDEGQTRAPFKPRQQHRHQAENNYYPNSGGMYPYDAYGTSTSGAANMYPNCAYGASPSFPNLSFNGGARYMGGAAGTDQDAVSLLRALHAQQGMLVNGLAMVVAEQKSLGFSLSSLYEDTKAGLCFSQAITTSGFQAVRNG
mmetsp:Transcript_21566/g.53223  ORF Transcript_21566/g.53223 Transcript_21566/m.53223 type:complete len:190 (-) Transcript_21566:40-609(-)